MKFANIALVKLFQFVTFVLFTFMVLVYFGTLILLPLDAFVLLKNLFSSVGLSGIAWIIALLLVASAGFFVYKMPDLYRTVLNIGLDLVTFGRAQVKRFEDIAISVKG